MAKTYTCRDVGVDCDPYSFLGKKKVLRIVSEDFDRLSVRRLRSAYRSLSGWLCHLSVQVGGRVIGPVPSPPLLITKIIIPQFTPDSYLPSYRGKSTELLSQLFRSLHR